MCPSHKLRKLKRAGGYAEGADGERVWCGGSRAVAGSQHGLGWGSSMHHELCTSCAVGGEGGMWLRLGLQGGDFSGDCVAFGRHLPGGDFVSVSVGQKARGGTPSVATSQAFRSLR
jgi:hypothetical protein